MSDDMCIDVENKLKLQFNNKNHSLKTEKSITIFYDFYDHNLMLCKHKTYNKSLCCICSQVFLKQYCAKKDNTLTKRKTQAFS